MINKLQKFLFNLSTASPIIVFTAVVWWIQCGKTEVVAENGHVNITALAILISIFGIVGFIFSCYSLLLIHFCKKRCELVRIDTSSVCSKDEWVLGVVVSYILPFSNLVLKEYNVILSLAIVVIILFIIAKSNKVYPNSLMMIFGKYHFYEITNVNGGEGFLLISRRKSIKNAQTVKEVITVWDYMMIEEV